MVTVIKAISKLVKRFIGYKEITQQNRPHKQSHYSYIIYVCIYIYILYVIHYSYIITYIYINILYIIHDSYIIT